MPKHHDAFALRDFDEKRILQRRFFRKLGSPLFDDEQILEAYANLAPCIDSAEMEMRMRRLRTLYSAITSYAKLLNLHTLRLKTLFNHYSNTARTAGAERTARLLQKYLWYRELLDNLARKFGKLFLEGEETIARQRQKEFGARLKTARLKKRLSRKQMAEALDLTENSYGAYETGRINPPLSSMIRVAKVLDISLDWLAGLAL